MNDEMTNTTKINFAAFFSLILSPFLIFYSNMSAADQSNELQTKPFIQYFDCMRSQNSPMRGLDVFLKVQDSSQVIHKDSTDYSRGLDIDLVETQEGALRGLQIGGPEVRLSLDDLKKGIQFGAFGKTMHTIELDKDFDSVKGGSLTMGFMKSISFLNILRDALLTKSSAIEMDRDMLQATRDFPRAGLSEKLARHYNSKKTTLWSQEVFQVSRENGKWIVKNSKGIKVDTIFAEMKILNPTLPVVLGLTQIQSLLSQNDLSCNLQTPQQVLSDPKQKHTLKLSMRAGSQNQILNCNRN